MNHLINIVVGVPIMSASWWFAVRILDSGNPRNKFGTAIFINLILCLLTTFLSSLGPIGPFALFFFVLSLFCQVSILTRHYDMGLLRAFGTLIVAFVCTVGGAMAFGFIAGALGLNLAS